MKESFKSPLTYKAKWRIYTTALLGLIEEYHKEQPEKLGTEGLKLLRNKRDELLAQM